MSQFGMQMPSGALQRGPAMNVYTGLLMLAVLALLSACLYIGLWAGPAIAPEGKPWTVHPYNESSKAYDIKLSADK
jgi:hypothetical protein